VISPGCSGLLSWAIRALMEAKSLKSRYALCCIVLFAALSFEPASPRDADVTFEQRLKAQRIIEKLYYSHQIGATRPFDEAVPRSCFAKKSAGRSS